MAISLGHPLSGLCGRGRASCVPGRPWVAAGLQKQATVFILALSVPPHDFSIFAGKSGYE